MSFPNLPGGAINELYLEILPYDFLCETLDTEITQNRGLLRVKGNYSDRQILSYGGLEVPYLTTNYSRILSDRR